LAHLADQHLSYSETGLAVTDHFPPDYDHDRKEVLVKGGQSTFTAIKAAIQRFDHFPDDWTYAYSASGRVDAPGQNVGVVFRQFGLWWMNGARVIEIIDRSDLYGFSYGTLRGHVERGEEVFYVRKDKNGSVYYGIAAYSKPRFWGARLLKFYARWQQRRFVRDSLQKMSNIKAAAYA
jgi:uncharacterized protein (UPF0548 family)